MHEKIVTRFAPSPTGFLHIGGVRTALYAWLWARKNNGTFILRIEDTDKVREVEGSVQHIQDSLSWLGIEWDYGPDKPGPFGSCIQSQRLDSYKKYAQILIDKGFAYPDPYTEEDVAAFRAQAEAERRPFLYRHHRPENFGVWDGTKPLRLKVPEVKRYEWHDVARGNLTAGEEMLDDIILIKGDGYPTYNFAHIVDDLEMGVTHIFRSDEFISSTPKYLSIYDALGIKRPEFVTLPPIMGPDGKKKLSKRDGAKDSLDYQTDGYLPEAICNFLALIGWNPGGDQELFFSTKELMDVFTLEKIHRSGGAFNEEKLDWMNQQHLKHRGDDFRRDYTLKALPSGFSLQGSNAELRMNSFAEIVLERTHNIREIKAALEAGEYNWIFSTPEYAAELLKWKNDQLPADSLPRLETVLERLKSADFGQIEAIKASIWDYAEEIGRGEVLWPLRVALSGRERSPDPFTLAFILGQAETLNRIQIACDKIKG